jgi:hypothetical protein
VHGDEATYQRKVYGDVSELDRLSRPPFVSFKNVKDGMEQNAWNLRGVYDKLWHLFCNDINVDKVDDKWLDDHSSDFDLVISTIPAPAICRRRPGATEEEGVGHRFTYQAINVAMPCGIADNLPDDTVVYEGSDEASWYRASKIFGITSVEWRDTLHPPLETRTLSKPIATNCDCHPTVLKTGRFGRWQKGILTHDAFVDTVMRLKDMGVL